MLNFLLTVGWVLGTFVLGGQVVALLFGFVKPPVWWSKVAPRFLATFIFTVGCLLALRFV